MSGTSSKTTVVSIRLPNETLFTLIRRINGRRSRWDSVGEYLRERVIYDTERSHKRKEVTNGEEKNTICSTENSYFRSFGEIS